MLKLAMALTKKSKHRWAFHGVIVIKGGAIIAKGSNHDEIHAEVNALNKLWPSKRKHTTVWSIRITPGGKLRSAKPCEECEDYLRDNKVKTVYYSDVDGEIKMMRL